MHVSILFVNTIVLIIIFTLVIRSYKEKRQSLKKKEVLFKKPLKRFSFFVLTYLPLFICLLLCMIYGYFLGAFFILLLCITNIILQLKAGSYCFCIWKNGVGILNGFNEFIYFVSWDNLFQWHYDDNNILKISILIKEGSEIKNLVNLTFTLDELDLFKTLMMKYASDKLVIS